MKRRWRLGLGLGRVDGAIGGGEMEIQLLVVAGLAVLETCELLGVAK